MTDRARHCYALLRTLFAWTPPPATSRTGSVLASQQRGFVTKSRFLTCPDCLSNGRPEGMHGCETCKGRGEVPDDGPDPYETKRSTRFGGTEGERAADRSRQVDDELRRLDYQLARPARKVDEQAGDVLTRAVTLRDGQYRHGSYTELEHALTKLRESRPVAYTVAMWIAYQPFGEAPIEPANTTILSICEDLAQWMPDPIRVPRSVAIYTEDERKRIAAEAHDALQYGHSDWARATRAERKRMILLLHGEGLSDGKIAAKFGLSRGWVQRLRAGLVDALDDCEAA